MLGPQSAPVIMVFHLLTVSQAYSDVCADVIMVQRVEVSLQSTDYS